MNNKESLESLLKDSRKIAIGVSGGADSMALLHMILQKRDKLRKDFKVLHVDDQLNPQSKAWAQLVQSYCDQNHMPCEVVTVDIALYDNNQEQASRKARYQVFAEQDCDTILLAHHANDQIETFFLKLFRGSGVKGLKGMTVTSDCWFDRSKTILRPLLKMNRHDIMQYVKDWQLPYVEDPSNFDTKFDRNWIRHVLMPMILERHDIADVSLLRVMNIQSETHQLLTELAAMDHKLCVQADGSMDWQVLRRMSLHRLKNMIMWICNQHNLIDVSTHNIEQFANGLINGTEETKNELRLRNFTIKKIGRKVVIL